MQILKKPIVKENNMTRKFKKAVRGVFADGKVTDDEKKAIFDLAKEENLPPHEV